MCTVVSMSEWGDPEREREAKEEVEVREKERTTVSGVQQRLQSGMETLSSWPHVEVTKQLEIIHMICCQCTVHHVTQADYM